MAENTRNAPINRPKREKTPQSNPATMVFTTEGPEQAREDCFVSEDLTMPEPSLKTMLEPSVKTYLSRVNMDRMHLGGQQPETTRVVAVRYFLDRPGYGLHNAAMRLWFHPPAICDGNAVHEFLREQGIVTDGLLTELFLDQFQAYMLLEVCQANFVEWDFSSTNAQNPGQLNVRFTDVAHALQEEASSSKEIPSSSTAIRPLANVSPSGLFAFSLIVALDTTSLLIRLIPGSVPLGFDMIFGPYAFFVGGLLQLLVGIFEVLRNNVYGATAFLVFGCIWLSNGTSLILRTFFVLPGTIADVSLNEPDPVGVFVREFYIFAFCCGLLVQTYTMNKLSSALIGLLCLRVFVYAISGYAKGLGALWTLFILGFLVSILAFYLFFVEFTNQIYHRDVLPVLRWSEATSPEEVFGASGRSGTLHSKAMRLRQANSPNLRKLRAAGSYANLDYKCNDKAE